MKLITLVNDLYRNYKVSNIKYNTNISIKDNEGRNICELQDIAYNSHTEEYTFYISIKSRDNEW